MINSKTVDREITTADIIKGRARLVTDKEGRWRIPGGTWTTNHIYAKEIARKMAKMMK